MIPILLAVLSYVGWGFGDSISARVFRKNNPSAITVASGFYRLLIWMVLLPFFLSSFHTITLFPVLFNLLAGLASGLGYYFFAKAMQKSNPSLVVAISGGWGVSAIILSLIFLSEIVTLQQWFSIIIVFIGLYLVSFAPKWLQGKKLFSDRGLIYAFLAFFLWGVCGAFLKIPANSYGWYWTSVIMLIPYIAVILLEIRKIKLKDIIFITDYRFFLLATVCTAIGDLGYNGSFAFGGSVAITGTIAGSYATNSTFLAHLFYREKMTKRQAVGVAIALIGIVFAAYFSSI